MDNSEIKYPLEPFEEFYHKFKNVKEMTIDPSWANFSDFYELEKFELEIPIGETVQDLNNFNA